MGANDRYWDASVVQLKGIRFYPIEAVDTEERAYRSGFLHLTQSVSADRIEFLKEKYPKELHFEPYLGTYFYRFNLRSPPFDDLRVRKAFSLAIDRQRLVDKVLKGGQTPATTFTPPGTGGFVPKPQFYYDPAEARELLNSYLTEKSLDSLPPIELTYNTSDGHKKVAEALHGMWKEVCSPLSATIAILIEHDIKPIAPDAWNDADGQLPRSFGNVAATLSLAAI